MLATVWHSPLVLCSVLTTLQHSSCRASKHSTAGLHHVVILEMVKYLTVSLATFPCFFSLSLRDLKEEFLLGVEISSLEKAPETFMVNMQLFYANSLAGHCVGEKTDMSVDGEDDDEEGKEAGKAI